MPSPQQSWQPQAGGTGDAHPPPCAQLFWRVSSFIRSCYFTVMGGWVVPGTTQEWGASSMACSLQPLTGVTPNSGTGTRPVGPSFHQHCEGAGWSTAQHGSEGAGGVLSPLSTPRSSAPPNPQGCQPMGHRLWGGATATRHLHSCSGARGEPTLLPQLCPQHHCACWCWPAPLPSRSHPHPGCVSAVPETCPARIHHKSPQAAANKQRKGEQERAERSIAARRARVPLAAPNQPQTHHFQEKRH